MIERDRGKNVGCATVSSAQAGSGRTSLAVVIAALLYTACAEPIPRSRVVPEELSMIVPLLDDAEGAIASNLIYEGNNALLRAGSEGRNGDMDGTLIAGRWRTVAERTRAIFVLRDSLWSQQDHPTQHRPVFLMLPPSWLVLAAMGKDPQPVLAFDLEDDAAWTALNSPADMFGNYPPSYRLFSLATHTATDSGHVKREIVLSARSSLIQLSSHTTRLQQAAAEGWRAVVSEGAEIIAEGDRAYFGETTRRDHVIPIMVENPAESEVAEHKGWAIPGLEVEPALARHVVTEICRRRLRDGDIALERYDLSDPEATERVLRILEWVVPVGEPGHTRIWLWVTGKLEPVKDHELRGEGAFHYVESFLDIARKRAINLERVRLFNKPSQSVVDPEFKERLRSYAAASLHMSVGEGTAGLLDVIEASGSANARHW